MIFRNKGKTSPRVPTYLQYIESVDRKCFIYTSDEVYESEFRLYELEQRLEEHGFFRVSKSFSETKEKHRPGFPHTYRKPMEHCRKDHNQHDNNRQHANRPQPNRHFPCEQIVFDSSAENSVFKGGY